MKVVILAGGLGSRLSEETHLLPKPMVQIGPMPILWHLMKGYLSHGYDDFIICLGYRGNVIKEFFANYRLYHSDVCFDFRSGQTQVLREGTEQWRVTCIDTGPETMTAGRIERVRAQVGEARFMVTYGDGIGDVDIRALETEHVRAGTLATVTAVQPSGRFGALAFDGERVSGFQEKPKGDGAWINAGFFVFEPGAFEYIQGDEVMLEREPMERLAAEGQLHAYKHRGFWKPMDTLRDKRELNALWDSDKAPWKTWDD